MLSALAETLRNARVKAGVKKSEIAAARKGDQSAIDKFERDARYWPENIGELVLIYADKCNRDPLELWENAFTLAMSKRRDKQRGGKGGKGSAVSSDPQLSSPGPGDAQAPVAQGHPSPSG